MDNFFNYFLFLLFCFCFVLNVSAYTILSCQDLQNIDNDLSGEYALFNDIDCGGVNFKPIGGSTGFSGSLNGNGFEIRNLSITNSNFNLSYAGLFGILKGEVRNLKIVNGSMTGAWSTIGPGATLGGITGRQDAGSLIVNSSFNGSLVSKWNTGGIAGESSGTILRSYSSGSFSAGYYSYKSSWLSIGGIVGYQKSSGVVKDCYSSARVESNGGSSQYTQQAAGLVGRSYGLIEDSYSYGQVIGPSSSASPYVLRGLVAADYNNNFSGTVIDSYWDVTTSGRSTSAGGVGLVTSEMKNSSNFVNWDQSIWGFSNDYPKLVNVCGDNICSSDENCSTCYSDCLNVYNCSYCGDAVCNSGENCYNCVNDCGSCKECGNGICENGESCVSCGFDCGTCNTYVINSCEDLQNISYDLSGNYTLVNDIDCSGFDFVPIGSQDSPFEGNLDGNYFSVSNLSIDLPTSNYVGLFSYISEDALISDINLVNANVVGNSSVGAFVGYAANDSNFFRVSVSGFVRGEGDYVGGFSGSGSNFSECISRVSVNGSSYVGGFSSMNSSVSNSYATGSVNGNNYVGGFVGVINYGDFIYNSYSTAYVSGSGEVGGLVGKFYDGFIIGSFYDLEISGQSDVGKGVPKTSSEMNSKSTFVDADWDFVNVWVWIPSFSDFSGVSSSVEGLGSLSFSGLHFESASTGSAGLGWEGNSSSSCIIHCANGATCDSCVQGDNCCHNPGCNYDGVCDSWEGESCPDCSSLCGNFSYKLSENKDYYFSSGSDCVEGASSSGGEISPVTAADGSLTREWTCTKDDKSSSCRASVPKVNGACNFDAKFVFDVVFKDFYFDFSVPLCDSGEMKDMKDIMLPCEDDYIRRFNSTYKKEWICKGKYGGVDWPCFAKQPPLDATCNSVTTADYKRGENFPRAELCEIGLSSKPHKEDNIATWYCSSKRNCGADVQCIAKLYVDDPQCGSTGSYRKGEVFPRGDLCLVGDPSGSPSLPNMINAVTSWKCVNSKGSYKTCSATRKEGDGKCGSTNKTVGLKIGELCATDYGNTSLIYADVKGSKNTEKTVTWVCLGSGPEYKSASCSMVWLSVDNFSEYA